MKERNILMADHCEDMILKGKEAYYAEAPILTDYTFDCKVLKKVGS